MNPAHGISRVSEVLDHENLRDTLHPGTPIGPRSSNRKARIAEGWFITNELRYGAIASWSKRGVTIRPGWFEGHSTKLVAIGSVDNISSKGF